MIWIYEHWSLLYNDWSVKSSPRTVSSRNITGPLGTGGIKLVRPLAIGLGQAWVPIKPICIISQVYIRRQNACSAPFRLRQMDEINDTERNYHNPSIAGLAIC